MNIETIGEVLLWSTLINYGVLLLWFTVFAMARDWMYRLHSCWFNLSQQGFDTVHYTCMALYKLGIFLFNLVPLIAICIVT